MNSIAKIVLAFGVFLAIGAFFSVQIVELFKSFLPESVVLISFSPIDVFVAIATVVVAFALVFTLPFVVMEILRFIKPALYEKERKNLFKFVPISIVLFVLGAVFGIYVMAFFGLRFFASLGEMYGIENLWSLSGLITSLAFTAIGFGITFQLPLAMMFAVKTGLVQRQVFVSARPYVLVGILILSALLTPPDVISQLLMTIPLYGMFEGTLLYLKFVKTNRKEEIKIDGKEEIKNEKIKVNREEEIT